ncbi:MAG: PilN domain-containing protein [Desulfobacterales bacterium]|jgi:type IV pilus assembly protein PilN
MIRINLLPFRAARKKENIRRQISVFFLSFFLMLAVLIYYNIHLGGQIKDLKTDVDDTKKEVAKFQKITKQIEEIKQKLAILEKKTEVIRTLETNRFEPVEMLDNMSGKIIANRMWFTSFDDRPQNVQIDGIALDNKTVADFMTRLEGTGLFGSVRLQTIQKHVVKGSGLKKFSITCSKPVPNELKKDQKKRT